MYTRIHTHMHTHLSTVTYMRKHHMHAPYAVFILQLHSLFVWEPVAQSNTNSQYLWLIADFPSADLNW